MKKKKGHLVFNKNKTQLESDEMAFLETRN